MDFANNHEFKMQSVHRGGRFSFPHFHRTLVVHIRFIFLYYFVPTDRTSAAAAGTSARRRGGGKEAGEGEGGRRATTPTRWNTGTTSEEEGGRKGVAAGGGRQEEDTEGNLREFKIKCIFPVHDYVFYIISALFPMFYNSSSCFTLKMM